ncbi:PIG-L deacetylase family protein [Thermoflavimicrobium dichotomicum]|uniref:N-acetylglucosaminyl deacetylase, LmbE family n=1 Tax=Thermoflavimicrobium dichotomicum TaxID=46223 RepID=A0A1I3JJ14_9BACL|nr:PIG-L family deacetylase [Thermoflavimicrobium dichotomicum]SFI60259.1 N-acetylglucosaminyl deacetylase, LmbE family [Thermoflavimicrobium dichotomicum]
MKQKSIIIQLIVTAILFLTIGFYVTSGQDIAAAEPPQSRGDDGTKTVIYYAPHADDEVLTYGIPIINDIRDGKNVVLVLLSQGEVSKALHNINRRLKKKITREEFAKARVREFHRAASILGVKAENQYDYKLKNMDFDHKELQHIILFFEKKYPHAIHKGMSIYDYHKDHADVGRALLTLKLQGKIQHYVTYASIYTDRLNKNRIPSHRISGRIIHLRTYSDALILDRAIQVYKDWDPENGWYACGYLSVPRQFKLLQYRKYTKETNY